MSDPDSILEGLADEFALRVRSGEKPDIEAYQERHPEIAEDISVVLSIVEMMEQLGRCETVSRRAANARRRPAPAGEQLGEFEIIRELGKGGMGVVYEAIDRTLERQVAVKVLNDSALTTQKEVKRFRRESRLAAKLHHTNIVPIFGVGEEEGKHYFAMQLIEGPSLRDLIAFRQEPNLQTLDDWSCSDGFSDEDFARHARLERIWNRDVDASPPRRIANWGRQVAEALDHAHRHGVLHRDIKPGNLLLDANETVWVTDFGLAKPIEADNHTNTGDILGTLRYMAPEQLQGEADERTDIYGVGLTLYELLTLQPVCDAENYHALFEQKKNPSHLALRKINPRVPRDLETIVHKALSWVRSGRYESAKELAEDLQRFLDDVPVSARRVFPHERLWRWALRNRLLATLASMVILLATVLPIVLANAYIREAEQSAKIETNLNVVLDGFDKLFGSYLDQDISVATDVAGASQQESAQLASAMLTTDSADALHQMLTVYDQLAEENPSLANLHLASESAKARLRVGVLYQQLGQFPQADEAFEDARLRYEVLSTKDRNHLRDLAIVHQRLGTLNEQIQRNDDSRRAYNKAIGVLGEAPPSDAVQFELARTHLMLGRRPSEEGRGSAEQPPPRGLPPHAPDAPAPPPLGRPGQLVDEQRRFRDAHMKTALTIARNLSNSHPEDPANLLLLARCVREEAIERMSHGELPNTQEHIEILEALVAEFPTRREFRFELCESYRDFGKYRIDIAVDERLAKLERAEQLVSQLVAEQRNVAVYQLTQAHIHAHMGITLWRTDRTEEALRHTKKSIATHEMVADNFPGLAKFSNRLTLLNKKRLANWLLELQSYEDLVLILQPLGERLYSKLISINNDDPALHMVRADLSSVSRGLLTAYEELGDDVGYLVALNWRDASGLSDDDKTHGPPPNFPPPPPPAPSAGER